MQMQCSMPICDLQAAKAALKTAAGALAEALAERDAAGDERASIEAQLQATLKSVAGDAMMTVTRLVQMITECATEMLQ